MSYAPKKVFILDKTEYIEISYQEFCMLRDGDESYDNRYFIPVQGMLLEVSENAYKDFYRDLERRRYLHKLDKKFDLIPIETVHNENANVAGCYAADKIIDIVDIVTNKIMVEKLHQCLLSLNDDEKNLIEAIYFNGMTEREFAKSQGVSQVAIHKRKHRILEKMKKFIENCKI